MSDVTSPLSLVLMGLAFLFLCVGCGEAAQAPASLEELSQFHTKFTDSIYGVEGFGGSKPLGSVQDFNGSRSLPSMGDHDERPLPVGTRLEKTPPLAQHGINQAPKNLDKLTKFHTEFTSSIYGVKGIRGSESLWDDGASDQSRGLISIGGQKERSLRDDETLSGSTSMNIGVGRVTVVAINVAEGGKAVATSDIVLSPVQISGGVVGSEFLEKLR